MFFNLCKISGSLYLDFSGVEEDDEDNEDDDAEDGEGKVKK